MEKCLYAGTVPLDNQVCRRCTLFLNTCIPHASEQGYGLGAECDIYLCEGCLERENCRLWFHMFSKGEC